MFIVNTYLLGRLLMRLGPGGDSIHFLQELYLGTFFVHVLASPARTQQLVQSVSV